MLDPFSSEIAKNIKSGVLLDDVFVKGILRSDEIGEKHLQDFALKRIKVNENGTASFFSTMKNAKLKTRFEVKVREAKVINQLKEAVTRGCNLSRIFAPSINRNNYGHIRP